MIPSTSTNDYTYSKRLLELLEYSYDLGVEDEMEDGNRSVAGIYLDGALGILYFYRDVTKMTFPCTSIPLRVLTDRMRLQIHRFCDQLTANSELAGTWIVEEDSDGMQLNFSTACPTQLPPEIAAFVFDRAMKQAARQTPIVRTFADQARQGIIPVLPNKTEV